ncbi:MAG: DUF4132 domain-containing protein [Granulosicoccus sp.]
MAREKTAEQILQRLCNKRRPLGLLIQDYLDNQRLDCIEQFNLEAASWDASDLLSASIDEAAETTVSKAVFELFIHRIASQSPVKHERPIHLFLGNCAYRNSPERPLLAQIFDRLREYGVDDMFLSILWISKTSEGSVAQFDDSTNPFEETILQLSDDKMLELFLSYIQKPITYGHRHWNVGPLQALIARDRPHIIEKLIQAIDKVSYNTEDGVISWSSIVEVTDAFDAQCIQHCVERKLFYPLVHLDRARDGEHAELVQSLSMTQPMGNYNLAMEYLADSAPQLMMKKLVDCQFDSQLTPFNAGKEYTRYFKIAAENWHSGGQAVFDKVNDSNSFDLNTRSACTVLARMLEGAIAAEPPVPEARQWATNYIQENPNPESTLQISCWKTVIDASPSLIETELWLLLQHKKKTTRSLAVDGLKHESINNTIGKSCELLKHKKADARLGAVELLNEIGNADAIDTLKATANEKHPAKVKQAITKALEGFGHAPTVIESKTKQTLEELQADIERKKKTLKLPASTSWLDLSSLPTLSTTQGNALQEHEITWLITKQARHKSINPAPDNTILLTHINRKNSGDFALAVLQQWLASSQQAADRWVLTLAGLLGDQRILPALTAPIDSWAKASRHKLAEYAAQAVALVPADESLMMLETLANRYSRRFRNIGKACKASLEQAARLQGVSMDELADIIVPTLGFNTDYQRALSGTDVVAVLQTDFKLMFLNPETETQTKSPPSSLPSEALDDIRTLRKLIRETVKGQTVRLEQALINQRRWLTARWSELFEVNPFLQTYASQIVWCANDANGQMRRLFRRYPNGLLANAAGELIELDDKDHDVVMAHPLAMDETTLKDWNDHFSRMKIKPPFAQLGRPVAKLDSAHVNRKSLVLIDGQEVASGTFRSRAEKLGWARGSMGDGATICTYYKNYPGTAVSVTLAIEDFYIGQDPGDSIVLGKAMFMKDEAEKTGNFVFNEASSSDDPRVLTFGEVPAVVYSETVTDLQAIIA